MSAPTGPPPPPTPPPPPGGGRPPRVGEVVGHYRVDSVLGVGGMGMVFSATDLRLRRQVALKVMLGHVGTSTEFQQRFQREASVLARLDSPHVVAIYDHGEQDGWPFIVTQYAAGGDLGRLLRDGGPLPPPMAFRVCAQVADGLAAAHDVGVVHRDVKPANVLLRDERTDRLHVYLCDFGVAHTEGTGLTTPGAVAGTWNYLSPERAAGRPGTPASDVYSVGCLLHESLTGRPPYTGADVEVAMAHVQQPVPQLGGTDELTRRINEVLARCLAKDPAERYPTARALRDALRALGGGHTPSTPSSPPLVLGRRRRRRRALVAGVLAAGLVAGGVATGVRLTSGGADPDPDPAPTTAPPQPSRGLTGGPAPEPAEPVTGDIDGDGLGDVATVTFEGGWLMRSDGESFGAPRRFPQATHQAVTGDVDGDGRLDVVTVDGTPPSLSVTVRPGSGPPRTTLLRTAVPAEYVDPTPFVGDVDGDGLDDVGIIVTGTGRISITVARAGKDGTLRPGRTWFTGRSVTDELVANAYALGDLTGDGRVDLVEVVEADDQPVRLRVLTSTGTAFDEALAGQRVGDSSTRFVTWKAGDFDGDGGDELAMVDDGPRVTIFRWRNGALVPERWIHRSLGDVSMREMTVTDVDGDGDDDLAVNTYDHGLRVLESSTASFRVVPGAGRIVADDKLQLGTLDRIVWSG